MLRVEAVGSVDLLQVAADATLGTVSQAISSLWVDRVDAGLDVHILVAEGDMIVGHISTPADVNLEAQRSILDALADQDAPGANIVAADALLQAGSDLGASGNFLDLDLSGQLTATAGRNVYLYQTDGLGHGVMNADLVKSLAGDVYLTAYDSILAVNTGDGTDGKPAADVLGNAVVLVAQRGTLGLVGTPLEIDSSFTAPGRLDATAQLAAVITETTGDLQVGLVRSVTDDVYLVADGSILDVDHDAASDVDGNDLNLTSLHGSVGLVTDDLEVDTNYSASGSLLNATAYENVYLTETHAALNAGQVLGIHGDVRLTVPDTAATGEDLVVAGGNSIAAPEGTVLLRVGDNVWLASGGTIRALTDVTIHGDYQSQDTLGTTIDLSGTLVSAHILIRSEDDIDTVRLGVELLVGHTEIKTADGTDLIIVDRLPSLTTSRDRAGDGVSTILRDTVDLDGQGDADAYVVNVRATRSDYIVNVHDTGSPDDGADVLTLNGTDEGDSLHASGEDMFLLRQRFVAYLSPNTGVNDLYSEVERINYDDSVNVLQLNGRSGADRFYSDDNSSLTFLDGGSGEDYFQFGQMFGARPHVSRLRRGGRRDRHGRDDRRLPQPRHQPGHDGLRRGRPTTSSSSTATRPR